MQGIVIENVITVVAIAMLGVLARQTGLVETGAGRYLSQLVMNITLPLLMFTAFTFKMNPDLVRYSLMAIVIAAATLSFAIFAAWVLVKLGKVEPEQVPVIKFIIIYGNTTFIGFPLCYILFGEEGLFLAAIYNFVHIGFMWTYGIWVFFNAESKPRNLGTLLRELFREPFLYAMLIGVFLAFAQIKLPQPVFNVFNMVGKATIPLSLLLVGIMLNIAALKVKDLQLLLGAAGTRLFLIPLLVLLALKAFNVPELVMAVSVIMVGTPSAALAPVFAGKYNGDQELAAAGVLASTILAAISLPVLTLLL
ncbi:MAG: AEC family transporter [Bacillota bacterium]